MSDPILQRVQNHYAVDLEPLVNFGLKYSGVLSRTPKDRIERAVREEVYDLVLRARAALSTGDTPGHREALELLAGEGMPRDALVALGERLRAGGGAALADAIAVWTGKHAAFESRVRWLLGGTSPRRREKLDPKVDTDELHHVLTSGFRFEARVLEMLAINRVAQSSTIGTFFRSTKEAEKNSVARFFDTYALYANVFEWGLDSKRGRAAIERMNQIHGRYYIPNVEMKFVLLQGAFTWLDGVDRLGHRPVTRAEREAMLYAWVRKGKAMHIQDLEEDYDEMYGWYRQVCEASADHEPYKRETFETIVNASLSGQLPQLRDGLFLAAKVAMDDTYRASVGYEAPSRPQTDAVRAVFFTVGSLIEQLPYTPYIRSLQNNPLRREYTTPDELGAPERSAWMPPAFRGRANGGFPEWQKPIRSADDAVAMELPEYTWDEVARHTSDESLWVVVDGEVYDVTTMLHVHPGGAKVLRNWAGKDASRAFHAARHSPGSITFSLNYRIGKIAPGPATSVAAAATSDAPAPAL